MFGWIKAHTLLFKLILAAVGISTLLGGVLYVKGLVQRNGILQTQLDIAEQTSADNKRRVGQLQDMHRMALNVLEGVRAQAAERTAETAKAEARLKEIIDRDSSKCAKIPMGDDAVQFLTDRLREPTKGTD